MAFAGTRTRGSACGCCGGGECEICQASGDIPFCVRLSGIEPDVSGLNCAQCDNLNTTFSGSGLFGGLMTLQECFNCSLDADDNYFLPYPASLTSYRACYKADVYRGFGNYPISIAIIDCGDYNRQYWLRAALLKPNQAGMGTDTTELHVIIYRVDGEVQLHAKYEFASIPFDCSSVDWAEMTIVENNSTTVDFFGECDWTGVTIEFKFGGDCDVTGSEAAEVLCCEDTTLPSTLVLNGTQNGSTYWTDATLSEVSIAAGYRYDSISADRLNCDFDGGDPLSNWAEFTVAGEGTMALLVHSCDPYHATGSATFGANTYSVEITE